MLQECPTEQFRDAATQCEAGDPDATSFKIAVKHGSESSLAVQASESSNMPYAILPHDLKQQ